MSGRFVAGRPICSEAHVKEAHGWVSGRGALIKGVRLLSQIHVGIVYPGSTQTGVNVATAHAPHYALLPVTGYPEIRGCLGYLGILCKHVKC